MISVIALAFVFAFQTQPVLFDKWKPGPVLKAELDRIEQEGREQFARLKDDLSNGRALSIEKFRRDLAILALKAWSFTTRRDEVATVAVVILGTVEPQAIFPRGLDHLPNQLQPGQVYPASALSSRRWQYVGARKFLDLKFAVFRLVE